MNMDWTEKTVELFESALRSLRYVWEVVVSREALAQILIIAAGVLLGRLVFYLLNEVKILTKASIKQFFKYLFAILLLPRRAVVHRRRRKAQKICPNCGLPYSECTCEDEAKRTTEANANQTNATTTAANRLRRSRR